MAKSRIAVEQIVDQLILSEACHIMRLIVGNRHVILVPACVLAGAALVMLSDTCSRVIFDPFEIPVGIMLTALGVPFFLFLLRKTL